MISEMEARFQKTVTIKTDKAPQYALDQVIARLKASDEIRWKGFTVTKEAVVNALWLWVKDMDPATVEKAMAVYVPKLEAILKGDPVPEVMPNEGDAAQDVSQLPPRRKGKSD